MEKIKKVKVEKVVKVKAEKVKKTKLEKTIKVKPEKVKKIKVEKTKLENLDVEKKISKLFIDSTIEINVSDIKIEEPFPEPLIDVEIPGLSREAQNWLKFLSRNQMTPEEFLRRYPTNKYKHQVEEIVQFNTKKANT